MPFRPYKIGATPLAYYIAHECLSLSLLLAQNDLPTSPVDMACYSRSRTKFPDFLMDLVPLRVVKVRAH
jgi:hypothetical protein